VKPSRPVSVADGNLCSTGDEIRCRVECATSNGADAENREVIARHEAAARMLWLAVLRGGVDANIEPLGATRGDETAEHTIVVADIAIQRIREQIRPRRPLAERIDVVGVADRDELLRVRDRQTAKQYRVNDRVDGRVGPDAKREPANDEQSER